MLPTVRQTASPTPAPRGKIHPFRPGIDIDELISIPEGARREGVSKEQLYIWCEAERDSLPYLLYGPKQSRKVVRWSELHDYIERQFVRR